MTPPLESPDDARLLASEMLQRLAREHPSANLAHMAAAVAMMLGMMVASMAALGATKHGRSGHVLRHLFDMAEAIAEEGLERA